MFDPFTPDVPFLYPPQNTTKYYNEMLQCCNGKRLLKVHQRWTREQAILIHLLLRLNKYLLLNL